jgi:hypothetical protein
MQVSPEAVLAALGALFASIQTYLGLWVRSTRETARRDVATCNANCDRLLAIKDSQIAKLERETDEARALLIAQADSQSKQIAANLALMEQQQQLISALQARGTA